MIGSQVRQGAWRGRFEGQPAGRGVAAPLLCSRRWCGWSGRRALAILREEVHPFLDSVEWAGREEVLVHHFGRVELHRGVKSEDQLEGVWASVQPGFVAVVK